MSVTIEALNEQMQKTFTAFKEQNDKMQAEIAKSGTASATVVQNVENLNTKLDELQARLDKAEKEQNRAKLQPGNSQDDADRAVATRAWMQYGTRAGINSAQAEAAKRANIDLNAKELVLPFGRKNSIGDAPQTVTTTGGGYIVKPATMAGAIEQALLMFNPMEQIANVITTGSGEDMNFATNNDTSNAGEMVAINTAVTEAALSFDQITLKAYKGSSKDVIVPFELIQDSNFNVESYVGERLGERLGRLMAAQCTTGAGVGSGAPTGAATIATAGVTAASQSAITYDELIDLEHSIDPAYRNPAMRPAYMFNDATLKLLRKLKDGNGQYIWDAASRQINGHPYVINQAMANPTTGLVSVLFGAWSKFMVRKVGEIRVIRDPYTYSTKDQTLFVAFVRFDSNLLDAGTRPLKKLTMKS